MTGARVATVLMAAGALLVLWAALARALGRRAAPVLAVLPLAAGIPWAKDYPATSEALALLLSAVVLYAWLRAREGGRREAIAALAAAAAAVALKPEIVLLPLAVLALELARRSRGTAPGAAPGAGDVLRAVGIVLAPAAVRLLIESYLFSPAVFTGLLARIEAGTAWNGWSWVFAGGDPLLRTDLAKIHGSRFYWALLAPCAALAWRCRREWWALPVYGWGAVIFVLTQLLVTDPGFRACPPMQAGLLLPFGAAALAYLHERKGRPKPGPVSEGKRRVG